MPYFYLMNDPLFLHILVQSEPILIEVEHSRSYKPKDKAKAEVGVQNEFQQFGMHLLQCFKCAHRWEQLQNDPHLHFVEIMASRKDDVPESEAEHFLSLRSNLHLRGCKECRSRSEVVVEGLATMNSMESIGQVITEWLSPRLVPVGEAHRSAEGEIKINAVMVNENEDPKLIEAGSLILETVTLSQKILAAIIYLGADSN